MEGFHYNTIVAKYHFTVASLPIFLPGICISKPCKSHKIFPFMNAMTIRNLILFLFLVMVFYCYGAGMMDYFAIYEPWKMIDAAIFPEFHQYQGRRVMNIFVLPSGIMTLFNILAAIFPVHYVPRKWLWLSLLAYAFDWIFSFSMQIPIQLKLEEVKDMVLLEELLRTNWWRFAADTIQFLLVCIILWKILQQLSRLTKIDGDPKTG